MLYLIGYMDETWTSIVLALESCRKLFQEKLDFPVLKYLYLL